jgi:SAM-dependent methyltransferase
MEGAPTVGCSLCGETYEVEDGIIKFSGKDSFYEFQVPSPKLTPQHRIFDYGIFRLFFLYLRVNFSLDNQRLRFLKRTIGGLNKQKRPYKVLDLGSGGGIEILRSLGKVTAFDISVTALKNARQLYGCDAYAGSARSLPFRDGQFDVVYSADMFGHFRKEEKDSIISEVRRILRDDGKVIFIVETDSTGRLFTILKKDPDLFQKLAVESAGHVGYEFPRDVLSRFDRMGFRVLAYDKLSPYFLRPELHGFCAHVLQAHRQLSQLDRWTLLALKALTEPGGGFKLRLFDTCWGITSHLCSAFVPLNKGIAVGCAT